VSEKYRKTSHFHSHSRSHSNSYHPFESEIFDGFADSEINAAGAIADFSDRFARAAKTSAAACFHCFDGRWGISVAPDWIFVDHGSENPR
jgi:hypothetical protein